MGEAEPIQFKVTKLKCLYKDCGHEWFPRFDHLPLVCPKCKRYGWNDPTKVKRKLKGGKKHVRDKESGIGIPKTGAMYKFREKKKQEV